MRFADRPLQAKLMLIIGLTVGAGLLISTLLFAFSKIDDNRQGEIDKLTGMPISSSDPAARADAIYQVLAANKIRGGEIGKFDLDDKHRGMGFQGTVSSTLSDAVRATEAVQPKGVDGFFSNISDGAGDLFANIRNGIEKLFSGLTGALHGAGHAKHKG